MNRPGHQVVEQWMGAEVVTLADLIPSPCRIMIVGINPAPTSVAVGHYWQGRLGQAFMTRLRKVGLLPAVIDGYEDDALLAAGVGLTDLVKRPTASANELSAGEKAYGRPLLESRIKAAGPAAVIFAFKGAATEVLGPFEGNGWLPAVTLGGAAVYLMPGPYAPRAKVEACLATLAARLPIG